MEFNIALQTIFYVMVLIIPGIIIRRCFYSGEFKKEFSQGNLMERFVWTIFCGIFVILVSSLFLLALRQIFYDKLLDSVSYDKMKELFDVISKNSLPESEQFFEVYTDFILLILFIYFFSILLGFISKRIVLSNWFIKFFPVFKYKNYWYYFLRGKVKKELIQTDSQYLWTEADVLVQQEEKTKLYSGKIVDYFIDSSCNKLESLFIEDTKRYKFDDSSSGYKLVDITGDVFYLPSDKIININLTYVKRKGVIPLKNRVFWWLNEIFFVTIFLFLFANIFVEDLLPLTLSLLRRIIFFLNGWFIITFIRTVFRKLIFPILHREVKFSSQLIGMLFFMLQFAWIIQWLTFWIVQLIAILLITGIILIFVRENKDATLEDESQND